MNPRNHAMDLQVQRVLLNAHQPMPGQPDVESVDPRAVGLISMLVGKPEYEAIVYLGILHAHYPTCPDKLVPEVDDLIERFRQREPNAYR